MKKVLILAANPEETARLRLDKEKKAIRSIFERAGKRDLFSLEDLDGVEYLELLKAMSAKKPRIVHFCGHANSHEIMLVKGDNKSDSIGVETLLHLFCTHKERVECVLINACSTAEMAKAISQHINYVIGMKRPIEDSSAIAFTEGFYTAIGEGETIELAFESGMNAMIKSSGGKIRDIEISSEVEDKYTSAVRTEKNLPPVLFKKKNLTPFPEDQVKAVIKGFDALKEAMSVPKVHDAVVIFKNNFQMTCEQIKILGFCKGLHDLLHELEIRWFPIILSHYQEFPDNYTVKSMFEIYEKNLQDYLSQYDSVIQEAKHDPIGSSLIKGLDRTRIDFRCAIEKSDAKTLKEVVSFFKHLLAIYPNRFNSKLVEAANNLRLSGLLDAMNSIQDALDGTNLKSEFINKIRSGTIALSELKTTVATRVADHDKWQILDDQLRSFENNLSELEYSWSFVKDRAEAISDYSPEVETLKLKAEINNLDNAFKANDSNNITKYFRSFRWQVVICFNTVDKKLNDLSEELIKVGSSLSTLLESIEIH